MIITNTDVEAAMPWPDSIKVQGGAEGVVLGGKGSYRTAFVEAFPAGTFLRGEGSTIADAERECWAKYQVHVSCDGTGAPHGPFEPRHYENGCGFCTRCGAWFTGVCEPSLNYKIDSLAFRRLEARLGDGWFALRGPVWDALKAHEEAWVRHMLGIGPAPGAAPELTDADRARLAEGSRVNRDGPDPEHLVAALDALAARLPGKEDRT